MLAFIEMLFRYSIGLVVVGFLAYYLTPSAAVSGKLGRARVLAVTALVCFSLLTVQGAISLFTPSTPGELLWSGLITGINASMAVRTYRQFIVRLFRP